MGIAEITGTAICHLSRIVCCADTYSVTLPHRCRNPHHVAHFCLIDDRSAAGAGVRTFHGANCGNTVGADDETRSDVPVSCAYRSAVGCRENLADAPVLHSETLGIKRLLPLTLPCEIGLTHPCTKQLLLSRIGVSGIGLHTPLQVLSVADDVSGWLESGHCSRSERERGEKEEGESDETRYGFLLGN